MTGKAVKYQVSDGGMVINVITLNDEEYRISQSRVDGRPHWKHARRSRWNELKKAVCDQEIGEWYVYDGFPNRKELKQASNTLHRKTDKLLQQVWSEHGITVITNPDELSLAVLVD